MNVYKTIWLVLIILSVYIRGYEFFSTLTYDIYHIKILIVSNKIIYFLKLILNHFKFNLQIKTKNEK